MSEGEQDDFFEFFEQSEKSEKEIVLLLSEAQKEITESKTIIKTRNQKPRK